MVLPGKRKPEEPGTGGTAKPKEVLRYLEEHAYMGGVFLWTFMDYYGEPAPFHWPGISSQFGITDTVGFEKDSFIIINQGGLKHQWFMCFLTGTKKG